MKKNCNTFFLYYSKNTELVDLKYKPVCGWDSRDIKHIPEGGEKDVTFANGVRN